MSNELLLNTWNQSQFLYLATEVGTEITVSKKKKSVYQGSIYIIAESKKSWLFEICHS